MKPNFEIEQRLIDDGYPIIAGVDEVGRGPLAGPVCAAAVILDPANIPLGLNDSKKLSLKRRQSAEVSILETGTVGVGWADEKEIDVNNILRASHIAMVRAIEALPIKPDFVLIDGNMIPKDLRLKCQAIVKGDSKSLSIAAASIVAKNRRDLVMCDLAQQFPEYGWDQNMGYPTKAHKKALEDFGVTPHHRSSFKPVHNILYQVKKVSD